MGQGRGGREGGEGWISLPSRWAKGGEGGREERDGYHCHLGGPREEREGWISLPSRENTSHLKIVFCFCMHVEERKVGIETPDLPKATSLSLSLQITVKQLITMPTNCQTSSITHFQREWQHSLLNQYRYSLVPRLPLSFYLTCGRKKNKVQAR